MINKSRIRELLEAYKDNQINRKDFDELHAYLLERINDDELDAYLKALLEEMDVDENLSINSAEIYNQIIAHPQFKKDNRNPYPVVRGLWNRSWRLGVAAMLCLEVALYLFQLPVPENNNKQEGKKVIPIVKMQEENRFESPMLMLADGSKINLDSVQNGFLSMQGSAQVVIKENGLTYTPPVVKGAIGSIPMNSIITPKGKQYQVVLPDGTKVWLNAATTLTYPVQFGSGKRIVEIEGEAYFDVVPDKIHPFVVKSNLQELEVLGTSFNISSYDDDVYVKTTLIEGKVQIKHNLSIANQSSAILKAGQQSTIIQGKFDINVKPIDTEEVVSWRKGLFVFNNEEIKEVMKKVSRWYNVDVEYENGMEGKLIGGSIQRFKDVDKLMKSLQATGLLHYKMEGGTITIMK